MTCERLKRLPLFADASLALVVVVAVAPLGGVVVGDDAGVVGRGAGADEDRAVDGGVDGALLVVAVVRGRAALLGAGLVDARGVLDDGGRAGVGAASANSVSNSRNPMLVLHVRWFVRTMQSHTRIGLCDTVRSRCCTFSFSMRAGHCAGVTQRTYSERSNQRRAWESPTLATPFDAVDHLWRGDAFAVGTNCRL